MLSRSLRTVLIALALGTAAPAAMADPSSQDIVEALLPLDLHGQRIKGARSTDALFGSGGARAIKVVDGVQVPAIDLRVAFSYDSDQLSNDGQILLGRLAAALVAPELRDSRFRIIGHTDARGSHDYNDDLSQRRAQAVVTWLAGNGVDQRRMEVSHRGKRELLPGIAPEDERNRRVEIQNTGTFTPG